MPFYIKNVGVFSFYVLVYNSACMALTDHSEYGNFLETAKQQHLLVIVLVLCIVCILLHGYCDQNGVEYLAAYEMIIHYASAKND